MSSKPNFSAMTKTELRTYVLEHRDDQEALQAYMDKLHKDNPNPRTYGSEDDVSEAISAYLKSQGKSQGHQKAS